MSWWCCLSQRSCADRCWHPPQHPSEDDFLFIFSDQEVFTKMLKRSDEVRVRCERLRQFTRDKKEWEKEHTEKQSLETTYDTILFNKRNDKKLIFKR